MTKEITVIKVTPPQGRISEEILNEFIEKFGSKIVKDTKGEYPFHGIINGIRICTEVGHSPGVSDRVGKMVYPSEEIELSEADYETLTRRTKDYGGRLCWITVFGPKTKEDP